MILEMDISKTLLVAVLLLIVGKKIRERFEFLEKYCIPAPVIGGLLFAIIHFYLYKYDIVTFKFSKVMEVFFMNVFFTASGFGASVSVLKKGGKKIGIFLILASVLSFFQNAVAVGMSKIVGIPPLLGLMTGSTPMTGGHGNAAAFGPIAESFGATGALSVAIAAATFGLVSGCIVGGPTGRYLINKYKLFSKEDEEIRNESQDVTENSEVNRIDGKKLIESFTIVFIGLGFGAYLAGWSKTLFPSVTLPIHVMGMLGGAIVTNILPIISKKKETVVSLKEIDIIGDISLSLFVSMAVMSMKLWELSSLALPIIVLLLAQVVLIVIFAIYVTFPIMGKNYDAAVISAGHIGFGLGAVPVSMANMKAICEEYRFSKIAFFVVPIIGGLFSNFTNAAIITAFLNFFK